MKVLTLYQTLSNKSIIIIINNIPSNLLLVKTLSATFFKHHEKTEKNKNPNFPYFPTDDSPYPSKKIPVLQQKNIFQIKFQKKHPIIAEHPAFKLKRVFLYFSSCFLTSLIEKYIKIDVWNE